MEGNWKNRFVTGVVPALIVALAFAVVASASPAIDDVVLKTRIWNDDPTSVLTMGETYTRTPPAGPESGGVWFDEQGLDGGGVGGWANRHNWRFSDDGGVTPAVFNNSDAFEMAADVTINGPANAEAALEVAPWWSLDVGGGLTVITWNGEIAAFGGRMPYYNFTANHGITYTKGQTVGLAMAYVPPGVVSVAGQIKYDVSLGGSDYTSGWLAFDEGNPAEDPPHGLWGILSPAEVGGYYLPQVNTADPNNWSHVDFDNIHYAPVPEPGMVALVALMTVAVVRKRR